MKLRFFKRMFVEKLICAGSLKLDAGSLLIYRLIFGLRLNMDAGNLLYMLNFFLT